MTGEDFDAVRSQLVLHEGNEAYVYDDATGKRLRRGDMLRGSLTVGVGHNVSDRPLSLAVRRLILDEDVKECLEDLAGFAWFGNLDRIRLRGVIDLRFQLGATRFRGFKKFLAAMARKEWAEAKRQLMDSNWYRDPRVQSSRKERVIAQICDGVDS